MVDEEKKETQSQPENAAKHNDEGGVKTTTPLIDQANAAAQRLEEANRKQEELLNRQEELMAKNTLGGNSLAGQEPEKKQEETPAEYAKRISSGKLE